MKIWKIIAGITLAVSTAVAVPIGPFATEDWVEEKLQNVESITNGLAAKAYVDERDEEIEARISGFATVEQVEAVSNAIPSVAGLATVEQVTAVSNLLPDVTDFATRQWVGQSITNAVDDLVVEWDSVTNKPSIVTEEVDPTIVLSNRTLFVRNESIEIPSGGVGTEQDPIFKSWADDNTNSLLKIEVDPAFTNWLATTNSATVQYVDSHQWDWDTQVTNAPNFATSVEVTNIVDVAVSNRLNSSTMAEVYDPEKTYFAGDYATYNGNLYKCLAENTGTFDTSKWQVVQLYKNKLYDAEVEWVEFRNGQYILTGVLANELIDFSATFKLLTDISGEAGKHIFGVQWNAELLKEYGRGAGISVYRGTNGKSFITQAAAKESFNTISLEGRNVYFNGQLIYSFGNENFTASDFDFPIGAGKPLSDPLRTDIEMAFSAVSIKKGGVLVRDYIAVRKGQVGYLYDRLSGQMFGNDGTGMLVPGPDKAPKLPSMDGVASAGTDDEYSRFDHVHPSDTSKADKVANATPGNFVVLESTGNIADSGVSTNLYLRRTGGTMVGLLDMANYSIHQVSPFGKEFWIYPGMLYATGGHQLEFTTNGVLKAGTVATVEDLAGFATKSEVPSVPVPVNQGGTGATTAENAAANLGVIKKSGDIMTGKLAMWEPQNGAELYFPSGGKAKLYFGSGLFNVNDNTGHVTIHGNEVATEDDLDGFANYQDVTNVVKAVTNLADRIVSGSNEAYVNSSGVYYKHPDSYGLPATLSFNAEEDVQVGAETFPSNYTVVINLPEVTASAAPPIPIYGISADGKWELSTGSGDASTGYINYIGDGASSRVFRITGFTGNNFSIVLDMSILVVPDPNATLTRSTVFATDELATVLYVYDVDKYNAKPDIDYENSALELTWGSGAIQKAYLPYYNDPSEFPQSSQGAITTNGNGSVNVARVSSNSVSGNDNFVFGNSNSVFGDNVTVFGNGNLVTNSNYAAVIGQIHTVKNSDNSIVSGGSSNNLEDSPNSIITGVGGTGAVDSDGSFVLSGGGGGVYNSPHATFLAPTGTSVYDSQNIIIGGYHHNVVSNAPYSVVLGGLTAVTNQYVFIWNGGYGQYSDHGTRTFNVNPVGGIEGFWIGETNLATIIQNAGGGGQPALSPDAIAPAWQQGSYTNGDFVIYNTHLYECTNMTSGVWTPADWKQTSVTEILGNLRKILDAINGEAL